jgi:hypothetical protein
MEEPGIVQNCLQDSLLVQEEAAAVLLLWEMPAMVVTVFTVQVVVVVAPLSMMWEIPAQEEMAVTGLRLFLPTFKNE